MVVTIFSIFQSTPSQRGRQHAVRQSSYFKAYFNPRPRKEGDSARITPTSVYYNISIHALAKRATVGLFAASLKKIYFNPRPRKEGDKLSFSYPSQPVDFNPRPRKEGDGVIPEGTTLDILFQSTPSQRGRRSAKTWQRNKQSISIHALAKRATFCADINRVTFIDFNPRPRKEGDTGKHKNPKTSSHFNPRPRKEGDHAPEKFPRVAVYFNPRPRKEGD